MSDNSENEMPTFALSDLTDKQLLLIRSLYPHDEFNNRTVYRATSLSDPKYVAMIGMKNPGVVPIHERTIGTVHKDYSGPTDIDPYIRYKISTYPTDWEQLMKIGQYLILNQNINSTELIEWSRYFSNLMIDQITEEGVTYLGNIEPIYTNTTTSELARPDNPTGYVPTFDPATASWAAQLQDIVQMTVEQAKYVLPVVFLFVLRSQLGIGGANYRRRLDRIGNFANIYTVGIFNIELPAEHKFRAMLNEKDGPRSAASPKDRDIVAKFIKLRTGIDTANIGRVALGIITQNTMYYGLSQYQCYTRLIAKLSMAEAENILGAVNQDAHTQETINFLNVIAMASKFPGDRVWYCMRAIDLGFYYNWSPRSNPWITLNLAYLEQKLLFNPLNTPYTSYLSQDDNTYKPIGTNREAFLDQWVNYWNANSGTINSGSLPPPINADVEVDPDLANDLEI